MYGVPPVKTFSRVRLLRRQIRNLVIAAVHRAPASPTQSAGGERQSSEPRLNPVFQFQSFSVAQNHKKREQTTQLPKA